MKLENKIKKLKGYRNGHRHFLIRVVEHYSEFFGNIKTFEITEHGLEDYEDYWISIYSKYYKDEDWDTFEKICDELKILCDGVSEENSDKLMDLNLFEN